MGTNLSDKDELHTYGDKMRKILDTYTSSYPFGLTPILDFLYLGGSNEATDLNLLKKHNITYVINCASGYVNTGEKFYKDIIKKYVEFDAEDDEDYDMMLHFDDAYSAIEDARRNNQSVLIHCIMGVNRSALLTVAYVMLHDGCDPIVAAEKVKKARRNILSNEGFRWQLLRFAKQRNMLDKKADGE